MKTRMCSLLLIALGLSMNGCNDKKDTGWRDMLASRLQVYGHRNWIVIADAAYPSQSRSGVETIVTREDHLKVIEEVLKAVGNSRHVQAGVHLDKELTYVSEKDAPGIEAYRNNLHELLGQRPINTSLHNDLIASIDEASKTFDVLILKSTLTLPYTSVFLELGCGYWNDEAESRLRNGLTGR